MEDDVKDLIYMLPQIDAINRLMITDSKGQHKIHKNTQKQISAKKDRIIIPNTQLSEDESEDDYNLLNYY